MTAQSASRPDTVRNQLKAQRRSQLLSAAATLNAERGFTSVRLEDLGAAVGISGPAVYRHFSNKEAVLVELLVGISQYLLDGGRRVLADGALGIAEAGTAAQPPPTTALGGLIDFHLDFAFDSPAFIRIQDRDLQNLPEAPRRKVRRLQREYVELWVTALCASDDTLSQSDARIKAHAVFGLINSTPYSAGKGPSRHARTILRAMAAGALHPSG